MKEATGELNMTLVTVVAVAAILIFVTAFVPQILTNITDRWGNAEDEADINDGARTNGGTAGGQRNNGGAAGGGYILKEFN